jgi:LCP family protein required for cell wall assembly
MGRYDDELDIDLTLYDSIKEGRKSSGSNSRHRDDDKGHKNNRNNAKRRKRKRRRKRRWPRVLFTLVVFIFAVIVCMWAIIKYVPGAKKYLLTNCSGPFLRCVLDEDTYKKIYDDLDDSVVNDGVDKSKFKGYYTVALFGIDSRDDKMDAGVNSDSIIIVSINQDTGKIVMSSIYRDTWLNIPDEDGSSSERFRKINSAFCTGGAQAAINTLNTNLDLNISDYITINFEGLATIIDMLGGIDINITEDERYYINHYMDENMAVTGIKSSYVKKSGQVHLDGLQATAYCRIRYCSFTDASGKKYTDDLGRTARQRYVLSLLVEKAKQAGVSNLLDIAEHVFSEDANFIRTSIEYDLMMDMIPTFIDFELGETKGFPFTYDFSPSYLTNGESAIGVGGLSYNVGLLHGFLYGDENYKPSKHVQELDEKLKEITGVEEIKIQ